MVVGLGVSSEIGNRARMMQYHQILAKKRKSDQPEETTVNELRVDDISME